MSQYSYKKYSISKISSPKTAPWIEIQQKNLLIQSRFSVVNQSIREKGDYNNQVYHEVNNSKKMIADLEDNVDKEIQKFNTQTNQMRVKVQDIAKNIKECQKNQKEKIMKIKQKIKEIKLKVQIQFVKQRYASQRNISQIQQSFEKLTSLLKNDEDIIDPEKKAKLKEAQESLHESIPRLQKQISTIRVENQTHLESIANELQKEIVSFKKKMISHQFADEQARKQLLQHTQQARLQIQQQIKLESATREQNKQKILMLFQNKMDQKNSKKIK